MHLGPGHGYHDHRPSRSGMCLFGGREGTMYPHLTYPEAIVVGLFQGVTELFPVSSLGHSVLIPALVGGSWEKILTCPRRSRRTSRSSSECMWPPPRDDHLLLAGLAAHRQGLLRLGRPHDQARPGTRRWEPQTVEQKLAWMIILATIPVGIAGLALEHAFRVYFSKPVLDGAVPRVSTASSCSTASACAGGGSA